MPAFQHFAAIDWSGAVGERHRGIAVAICDAGHEPPRLVETGRRWSRLEVLEWLAADLPPATLAGLDLGISLPFLDRGAFFPGWDESPANARELWALVDNICAGDRHLAAGCFVDHPEASRHFRRHGGRLGDLFGSEATAGGHGRLRVTEHAQRLAGCTPYSNFNLIGAAQVGKSSLTGMRLLNRLSGRIPIWPIDPLPASGSAIVEIYTSLAAIHAGRSARATKLRTFEELNAALGALGSRPVKGSGPVDDHRSDALLTAAWLRKVANRPEYWSPKGLTPQIAATEGWTFGAV